MDNAFPAMSLNSAPGLRDRINVADDGSAASQVYLNYLHTSENYTKIASVHEVTLTSLTNSARK